MKKDIIGQEKLVPIEIKGSEPNKDLGFVTIQKDTANKNNSVLIIGYYSYTEWSRNGGVCKSCNKRLSMSLNKEELLRLKQEIENILQH